MSARKPKLVNAAPQSGHISPLPWTLEVDAYGTNLVAADGSRVAYVHSCSCNAQADADAELLVSAPALKMKVGVLEEERRSLLGNLEDQTNATAAQRRRADELLAERAMLMALAQRIASASDPGLGDYATAAREVLSTIKVNE